MVQVINQIVVPGRPAVDNGLAVPPFTQVHLHSTGNPNSTMQNERDYLASHWGDAYYTHLVGFNHETGHAEAWQVAQSNGGGYDLGGDWNWEGYASIEFVEGSIQTQAQFNEAYNVYITLARQLQDETGQKVYGLDTASVPGIKTHNYASRTGHGSDHVDPIAFLEKWGVGYDKLISDIKKGLDNSMAITTKETVFQSKGLWYTDKKYTKKANAVIAHMGAYWAFRNGKLLTSQFVESWGNTYWAGGDGKIVQGFNKNWNGLAIDFGTDDTFYIKSLKIVDAKKFTAFMNKALGVK